LLTFYGIGGQGKSALCDAFIRHLEKEKPRKAAFGLLRIDQHNRSRPQEALLDLRLSLGERSKVPFHAFDIAFSLYWAQAYPEQNLRNYRNGRIGTLLNYLPDIAAATAEAMEHSVPGLGLFIRLGRWLKEKGHEKWAERTIPLLQKLHDGKELMPSDQIVDRLPLFLATDLNIFCQNNPDKQCIIFIDEYEQLWIHNELKAGESSQLVDEAIKELVADSPGMLFVLFSREKLHWDRDHSGWIDDLRDAQYLLGGLSATDANVFLNKCEIIEQPLREAIIAMSGGDTPEGCHPELLDLAVDHYLLLKFGRGKTPDRDEFQADAPGLSDRRHKLMHRFLRGCNDRSFRDTLRYLAVAEHFGRSLFEALAQQKTGFPPSGFDHLISYSFVQSLEEKRYRLHPRIREVLIEDLSPNEHQAIQDFYFHYYDARCRPPSPVGIAPEHETALLAAAKHLLALDDTKFPDWFDGVQDVFWEGARFRLLEPLLKRSLVIEEKSLGQDHPDVAANLNILAQLYYYQGRYEEALPLFQRSLAIQRKSLGQDHPDVAANLNNIAQIYSSQGRYAEALPLYQCSLAIWEKALGQDHPNVATSLNNLALLYFFQGRNEDALPLFQRALVISEKALGKDHPDVSAGLNNMAQLYFSQGRDAEALSLFQRSLAIKEKALGQDHPRVATNLSNIAQIFFSQRRYADALPLFQRSLAISEKTLGLDHPDGATLLNNIAEVYTSQGRYAEALPLYQRSLAIWEKAQGQDHPNVATSLNNLALLYFSQGRNEDALPLFQRSLVIREKALGKDHPDVAASLNNIAGLYFSQGRYADALPLHQRALAIREKALGQDHPNVATSLNNIAEIYSSQGHHADALPLFRRSLAILEKALGQDHPDVAASLNNIAGLYFSQGRYADALPLFQRALTIRETAQGPDHPDVAQIRQNLSQCQERLGG